MPGAYDGREHGAGLVPRSSIRSAEGMEAFAREPRSEDGQQREQGMVTSVQRIAHRQRHVRGRLVR